MDRPVPEPGPGEVRVRVAVSGVNPTDWKSRAATAPPEPAGRSPNQDGAGVVDAVGHGRRPGARSASGSGSGRRRGERPWGTAAEYTVVPARQTVLLGPARPFELGRLARHPVPHRAPLPRPSARRCRTGSTRARWPAGPSWSRAARARSATPRSSSPGGPDADRDRHGQQPGEGRSWPPRPGPSHVIDYRTAGRGRRGAQDRAGRGGRDRRGAGRATPAIDAPVIGMHGGVAVYADDGGGELTAAGAAADGAERALAVRARLHRAGGGQGGRRSRTSTPRWRTARSGSGGTPGLPLHRFPLGRGRGAHAAVEDGAVGKVLVDIP